MERQKFQETALPERDRDETSEAAWMKANPNSGKAARILRLLLEYGREAEEKEKEGV